MFLCTLENDIKTIFEKDPAAKNIFEVLCCYPGLHALLLHRVAHKLHKWGWPLIPRLISSISRILTGIEIHPGAQIGNKFFIDHGMGVVIGETTVIGNNVLVYQGVTLGGTGKEIGKRHPTIKDNVVFGSGSKVLGNITIGNNVRVGAGSVVITDVPDDSTVVGIPGRIVMHKGEKWNQLQHNVIPDPIKDALYNLTHEIKDLKKVVKKEVGIPDEAFQEFEEGGGI